VGSWLTAPLPFLYPTARQGPQQASLSLWALH
jgi:hypothetical protein